MVPTEGFEPPTYALRVRCTTTVLSRQTEKITFYFKASFLEKLSLPFLSVPIALTSISSPSLTTSSTFSTRSLASLEICTKP